MSLAKTIRRQVSQAGGKARGDAARLLAHLPAPLQLRLARLMGYQHEYAGLDPHIRLLLAFRQLEGGGSLVTRDAVKSRRNFRREMLSIAGKPTPVAEIKNFQIDGPAGKLNVRHYRTEQGQQASKSVPLLVFYHGGGFVVGDLDTHDEACRLLCHKGKHPSSRSNLCFCFNTCTYRVIGRCQSDHDRHTAPELAIKKA
jgi:acetyl esterase